MTEKQIFYTSTKRLSDFLQVVRKSPGEQIRSHLAKMQHFDSKDTTEAVIAYAELIRLARDAKLEVQSMDDLDQDLNVAPIVQIAGKLANLSTDHTGSDIIGQLGEHNLLHLQHTAQLLKNPEHERRIPQEALSSLLDTINEFVKDIINSDTPSYLKELLLEHLYNMERAINAYQIRGAKGLQKAVEQGIGAFALVFERVKRETGGDNKNPLWQRFMRFYGVMMEGNKLISLARNLYVVYQIGDSLFGSYLLSGD